jgi:choline-sulfatase
MPLGQSIQLPGLMAILLGAATAHAADRPNVLIIYTDQQQYGMMSVDGHLTLHTPAKDNLAKSGARFTHAFCITPQCSPSRAATITGRYPHQVNMMGNHGNPSPSLDAALPTLGKIFKNAGYATAYFGKWHLGGELESYGFQQADQKLRGPELADHVADYLKSYDGSDPFFLVASFINPHDVYEHPKKGERPLDTARTNMPASIADDLSKKPWPQSHFLREDQGKKVAGFNHDDWKQYIRHYESLVEKIDGHFAVMLEALDQNNLRENTIIVLLSDHGDSAGAHGLPFKYPAMYEELIRVPLLIAYPQKIQAGSTVDHLVTNLDLFPTLCDLTGVEPPAGLMGESLGPLLTGNAKAWRDAVICEYYGKQNWMAPIRMIRTERWKYCLYQRHGEELYDLHTDPHEMHNLATAEDHQTLKARLKNQLNRWMIETNDPFALLAATDRNGATLPADWKPTP